MLSVVKKPEIGSKMTASKAAQPKVYHKIPRLSPEMKRVMELHRSIKAKTEIEQAKEMLRDNLTQN